MDTSHWTEEEFMCLLLIYVSHVDIEYTEEEKMRIMSKFPEDTYDKVYGAFDVMSDFEALQCILSFKKSYFNDAEAKQDLLDTIKIQFFVDGEYSIMEKEIYHFFEKLL